MQLVEYILYADELIKESLINTPKVTLYFEKQNNYFWRVLWEDGEFIANVHARQVTPKTRTAL